MSRPTEKPLVRAAAHLAQGSYAEAAGAFRAVLSIDPNEHRAYLGLADCAVGRGSIDEAVEELVGTAQDFAERGLLPPAFSMMTKALAVDPSRLELHIDVAELEASAGRLDMAIARLENLARVYLDAGRDEEAEAVLEAAMAFEAMNEAPVDEAAPAPVEEPLTVEAPPAEIKLFEFAGPVPTDFAEDEIGAGHTAPAPREAQPPARTGDTFVGPAPGPAPRAEQTVARTSARRRNGTPRWRASTIQMAALTAAIPEPSAVPVSVEPGHTKALIHSPPRPPKARVSPAPAPVKPVHTQELVFKPIAPVAAAPKVVEVKSTTPKLPIKKLPGPKKTVARAKPVAPRPAAPKPRAAAAIKSAPVTSKPPAAPPRPSASASTPTPSKAKPVAKIVLSRPAKPAPKATSDRAQAESLADRLRRASGSKRPERPQLAAKLRNLSEHEKRRARGETFEEDPTRLWCPERLLIEGGAGQ